MRIFISFSLPEKIKLLVQKLQTDMQTIDANIPVRWTEFEKIHQTLEFLGELSEEKVGAVRTVLRSIIPYYNAPLFILNTVDAFPNLAFPEVLFLGVRDLEGGGELIHNTLAQKLDQYGIRVEEHAWRPHITLGRVRHHWKNAQDFSSIKFEKEVWNTISVQIIESRVVNGESHYFVIDEMFFREK